MHRQGFITDIIGFGQHIALIGVSVAVVVDSAHYYRDTNIIQDSFGNTYHESFRFRPGIWNDFRYDAAYVVYNLNRSYSTFSADIVIAAGVHSNAEFMVEVTLDNNLTPVRSVDGIDVRTGSMPIEVDVSGVTTMTITVRGGPGIRGIGTARGDVRLVNALLHNND